MQISKIMEQNRVKKNPYDKNFLIGEVIYSMKKHQLFCYQKNHF